MKTCLCLSSLLFVMLSAVAGAVELPVNTNFNSDVIGLPPAIGGPDQPTALFRIPRHFHHGAGIGVRTV